ncbi:MAG: hypothetical protein FWC39_09040 [Bacteroidetes bacterium]|nr:hypothetical protein [Bacteroidota bacterium]
MKQIIIVLHILALHGVVFAQSNYTMKFDEQDFSFLETEKGYEIVRKNVDY